MGTMPEIVGHMLSLVGSILLVPIVSYYCGIVVVIAAVGLTLRVIDNIRTV